MQGKFARFGDLQFGKARNPGQRFAFYRVHEQDQLTTIAKAIEAFWSDCEGAGCVCFNLSI